VVFLSIFLYSLMPYFLSIFRNALRRYFCPFSFMPWGGI
jgi:hypothetical protein